MDIDQRLENWQRAFREHRNYRVTPSLEGRYKSPQHWDAREPKVEVNMIDALAVERAAVGMPQPYKAILKFEYFQKYFMPIQRLCKKYAIRISYYDIELDKAKRMIINRLK